MWEQGSARKERDKRGREKGREGGREGKEMEKSI